MGDTDIKARIASLERTLWGSGHSGDADQSVSQRLKKIERHVQSILDSNEALKTAVETAEEVLSSPLLPLDNLAMLTPPESARAGSSEHKSSTDTDERDVDAALLLESAEQIEAMGSKFQRIASLQAAAFDAKALTGLASQRRTLENLAQKFNAQLQQADEMHEDTEALLEAYSNLVDYVTAETIILDAALPKEH